MDSELREAFQQLEERLRQHIDLTGESLRTEIRAGDAKTREVLEAEIRDGDAKTREVLEAEIRDGDAKTREVLGAEIRAGDADTRRHIGVLTEALRADFSVATEGIDALNSKFDALRGDQEHTRRRLDLLEARVTVLERDAGPGSGRRRR